jgi:transcriptional regulator with XRE-family HTH domain
MSPEEIKTRRNKLGLTQGELAERLGVAVDTVARWELGTSAPESAPMLDLALKHLEMTEQISADPRIQKALNQLAASRTELRKQISEV